MNIQQPLHNCWRSFAIASAAASIPLNIILMVWLIQFGTAAPIYLVYAILAAIPGVAILTDLWIIFSTSFKPSGTLCCFWGWIIGHMILILPDVALNILFAYYILAPADLSS